MEIKVSGVVQGVGFRYFTEVLARQLGIKGWVRNERDGSVCCEAQGSREDLDRFLEGLRRGPQYSRVERVDTCAIEVVSGDEEFVIN